MLLRTSQDLGLGLTLVKRVSDGTPRHHMVMGIVLHPLSARTIYLLQAISVEIRITAVGYGVSQQTHTRFLSPVTYLCVGQVTDICNCFI